MPGENEGKFDGLDPVKSPRLPHAAATWQRHAGLTTRKAVHPRISKFENHIITYGTSCLRHLEGPKEKKKEKDCASSPHLYPK